MDSRISMSDADGRKLIFRLAEMGFLLEVADVVEVIEQIAENLDPGRSDIGRGIVSALQFRQTWIPAIDPTLRLDISSTVKLKDKVAVILCSSEGNWALLVDQVDLLSLADNFQSCEIPFLLKVATKSFYSQVNLLHGEPLIVFEPEHFYGTIAVPA